MIHSPYKFSYFSHRNIRRGGMVIIYSDGILSETVKGDAYMDIREIERFMQEILDVSAANRVPADAAIRPDLASMRMYGRVLVGVAGADDDWFERYRERHIVGPHFMYPREWLPAAASVVSVFFAFAENVIRSNALNAERPSDEWLYARYEGQRFIDHAMAALKDEIEKRGYEALVPLADGRFVTVKKVEEGKCSGQSYTSNWSERHVAFACGLGTFGLSAGLITKYGIAGRFGSLVTSLSLEPTIREYADPFEHCTLCGVCVRNCPAGAISRERGKAHLPCSRFVDETRTRFAPRYGCGKCQVGVPCQMGIPAGRR